MKRLLGMLAVAAVAAATPAFAQIKIATVGPMTGQYAAFGEQMKRGAEMAVKDINAAGGVNGQQLVLQIGDDACDPKQATAVANQLVSDKVVFVAGHYCSGSSIPASDIYKEAKILQITPASTNIKLTDDALAKGNTTVFRTCGRDDVQGATVGAYILKNNKNAKIAVLHDKSPYGKGVADETVKALNKGGMKQAMYEAYNDTDKDFTALINKMKQAKIDMIVLGGYHTAAAMLVKQSREQGFGAQLVGFDALEDPEFGKLGGAATNGVLMSFPPKAEDFPINAALVKKFRDFGLRADRLHAVHLRRRQGVGRCRQQGQVDRRRRRRQASAFRHLPVRRRTAHLRRRRATSRIRSTTSMSGRTASRRRPARSRRRQGRREGPAHAGPFSLRSDRLKPHARRIRLGAASGRRQPLARWHAQVCPDPQRPFRRLVAAVFRLGCAILSAATLARSWSAAAADGRGGGDPRLAAGGFPEAIQRLVGHFPRFWGTVTPRPRIWYPGDQQLEGIDRRDAGGHHRGRVGSCRLRPEGNSEARPARGGSRRARSRH